MCQDIGSFEARAKGVDEAQLARPAPLPRQRALRRDRAARARPRGRDDATPRSRCTDELLEALRGDFDGDAQLVELVHLIAVENLRSRFNGAFGLGAAGFSEGMACARMETGARPPRGA